MLRAAVADCHGQLDHQRWEASASGFMQQIWFTDCKSCFGTLQKPVAKSVDKRLGMELASLRQHLWREAGQQLPMIHQKPAKNNGPKEGCPAKRGPCVDAAIVCTFFFSC